MFELLSLFAEIFPLGVFALIITIFALSILVSSRMSLGTSGAGPLRPTEVEVPGLKPAPWDAIAADQSLSARNGHVLTLLQQRASAMGIPVSRPAHLTFDQQASYVLDQLEEALQLPPLKDHTPPRPTTKEASDND